jgi:hypothetical protein
MSATAASDGSTSSAAWGLGALRGKLSEALADGGPVRLSYIGAQVGAGVVLEFGDQPV